MGGDSWSGLQAGGVLGGDDWSGLLQAAVEVIVASSAGPLCCRGGVPAPSTCDRGAGELVPHPIFAVADVCPGWQVGVWFFIP